MTDDITFTTRYALLLQGLISTIIGWIAFIQGALFQSDEVAQMYYAVPLALGLICLIMGILTSTIIRFRRESVSPKFSVNIGEFLLLAGFAAHSMLALTQLEPEWFNILLIIPIALVLLSSMVLLLRTDYMEIISQRSRYYSHIMNFGIFLAVVGVLIELGNMYGFIAGIPSATIMTLLILDGALFVILGLLITRYRREYEIQQSRLGEEYPTS